MARKARPHTPQAIQARQEIERYLEEAATNVNALADRAGTCQSTLFRFVSGQTKTVTDSVRRVLDYMHSCRIKRINVPADSSADAIISAALARSWDGERESAELIAGLIDAVMPILQTRRAMERQGKS